MKQEPPFKILLLSNWYPSRENGFSGDFVQRHAQAIALFNEVTIVYFEGDPKIKKVEIEKRELTPNLKEKIIYFPKSRWPLINFIRKSRGLQDALAKEEYELVHLNVMYYHFWPLLFLKKPLLISEHFTGLLEDNFKKMPRLFRWMVRKLLQKSNHVTAVSQNLGDNLSKIQPDIKLDIIPNVVDHQLFKPRLKQPNPIKQFLHISNLAEYKNIPMILQATQLLSKTRNDFVLKIGGNGDSNFIQKFIDDHNLQNRIEILPPMNHQEVADQMQAADAFILFSATENQPCVIIEAFACGLPVISTNVGGISEFFPEHFGTIVENATAEDLKKSMEDFLNKGPKAEAAEMHEFVNRHFSPEVIGAQFTEVYQQILGKEKSK